LLLREGREGGKKRIKYKALPLLAIVRPGTISRNKKEKAIMLQGLILYFPSPARTHHALEINQEGRKKGGGKKEKKNLSVSH